MLRRRRCVRPLSSKSSVPDYSSEFFEDEDDDDFAEKNAVIQVKLNYISCKTFTFKAFAVIQYISLNV